MGMMMLPVPDLRLRLGSRSMAPRSALSDRSAMSRSMAPRSVMSDRRRADSYLPVPNQTGYDPNRPDTFWDLPRFGSFGVGNRSPERRHPDDFGPERRDPLTFCPEGRHPYGSDPDRRDPGARSRFGGNISPLKRARSPAEGMRRLSPSPKRNFMDQRFVEPVVVVGVVNRVGCC